MERTKTYIPVSLASVSRSSREGWELRRNSLSSIANCASVNLFLVLLEVLALLDVVVSEEILVDDIVRESLEGPECGLQVETVMVEGEEGMDGKS